MIALLAIAAAVAAGCLFVIAVLPRARKPRWAVWLLAGSLGAPFGIGLTSCVYFVLLLGSIGSPFLPIGITLAGAAACFWLVRKYGAGDRAPQPTDGKPFQWNWALLLALIIGVVVVFGAARGLAAANPDGQWDAWSIWNLRARFMSGPQTWKLAVSPLLESTHPDYPLLQSGFVGLIWSFSGAIDPTAPLAVAFVFFASVLGALAAGLTLLRGTSTGLLAALVALTATAYVSQPPAQYADVPQSAFYLGALLLIALAHACGRPLLLAFAGLFASFAAWTKNEGIAFLAILLLGYLIVGWQSRGFRAAASRWLYLALGAVPGVVLTALLKLWLAPSNDPLFRQGMSEVVAKMFDLSRHVEILKANFTEAATADPWYAHPVLLLIILAFALRFRIDPKLRSDLALGVGTLASLFAVYWGVYLASTSLTWQLDTSLARLHAQLWPPFLLMFFLALGRIEDRSAAR